MKLSDLSCCPFCGNNTFYVEVWASGKGKHYSSFDGDTSMNTEFLDQFNFQYGGQTYCSGCNNYLGNKNLNTVGVNAEEQYYLTNKNTEDIL